MRKRRENVCVEQILGTELKLCGGGGWYPFLSVVPYADCHFSSDLLLALYRGNEGSTGYFWRKDEGEEDAQKTSSIYGNLGPKQNVAYSFYIIL